MITIVEWCKKHNELERLNLVWSKENTSNPAEIDFYTKELFYFKCSKNHKWKANPYSGLKNKNLCPYCSRKKVSSSYNLKVINPRVADEWDYQKNGSLRPEEILPSIGKKVWWICQKGHEWQASVNSRARGSNCPYCSHNLPSKTNNLKALYPEVAKNWDYQRNTLKPEDYLPYSTKKVWWICDLNRDHHYQSYICNAIKKPYGCPICRKGIGTSFPEQTIYYYLKKIFPDCQNRVKIKEREFDIYIPTLNFVIEYDGIRYHNSEQSKRNDKIKDNILYENNIDLLRIIEQKGNTQESNLENNVIYCYVNSGYHYLNYVVQDVLKYINQRYHKSLCMDIDVDRDSLTIYSQFLSLKKENSLLKRRPELIEEWDFEKNRGINPEFVSPYSRIKLWWKCRNGHSWQSTADNRSANRNCPYCSNQKINFNNSFASFYPELVRYWHKTKNDSLKPENVSPKSGKRVWWQCEKGHEWQERVYEITKGNRCPYCSNHRASVESNICVDAKELLEEWNYEKNNISPTDIKAGSGKKVWWKCKNGHEWQNTIANMISQKISCPFCKKTKISKDYNLKVIYPKIAEEWDYKNNDKGPEEYFPRSSKKVWWTCQYGHHWQMRISKRKNINQCPYCK